MIFSRFFDSQARELANAKKTVQLVNDLESEVSNWDYAQMQSRIAEIKSDLAKLTDTIPHIERSSLKNVDHKSGISPAERAVHARLMEFMPEVYAMVREIMRRDFDRRHYDVQILASVILAQGQKLTELKTGEGKTQVFQLPLILFSLAGRGSHLVTVNEYLAKRDGEYLGHVASRLGLSVGIITPGNTALKYVGLDEVRELKGEDVYKELKKLGVPGLADMKGLNLVNCTKREAYVADMTVGVNNEFGFDYLRDNMASSVQDLVQRELYFCIVDEADSILIDEARTPLIISAMPEDSDIEKYRRFAQVSKKLEENVDYEIDHKTRTVLLTEDGIVKAEQLLGIENVWADYASAHHLENAIKAKALYLKDDEYIVQNGEVLIVDSFTGRVMPGRRYSEGIHQAIEAKEGVDIQQESKTMATITFQNYFRLYKYLCGGSGTIMTEAEEFYKIYQLESLEIPTHRPVVREDRSDLIYKNQEIKFRAVVQEVKEKHEAGQPVLVGTTSVEKSEIVSRLLDSLNIPHNVLNAKQHDREAQIVAKAGEKGAVTVATNMAGRGTDIPLAEGVKELGGLAVIGTERHEARRIDNQLRGRSGRQGDPGYTRFYVALDDTIMRILGGEFLERFVGRLLQEDMPIELGIISKQIETAQKRVEGRNFDIRKNLVEYDDVMNKHREVFYSRRRQILELADQANGYFTFEVSSNESADDLRQEALDSLRVAIKDVFREEIEYVVSAQFMGDNKLTDDARLNTLVDHILDFGPDKDIASAFDIKLKELDSKLKDTIRGTNQEWTTNYVTTAILQLVESKIEEVGGDFPMLCKVLLLDGMNRLWMEHLETMSDIRSGISLQSYAQRDPLVEYKTIGFQRFEQLMRAIDSSVARRFLKVAKVEQNTLQQDQRLATNNSQIESALTGGVELAAGAERIDRQHKAALRASGQATVVNTDPKVGRNDLCPCGSGKKYKHCGLKNTAEHQKLMK